MCIKKIIGEDLGTYMILAEVSRLGRVRVACYGTKTVG